MQGEQFNLGQKGQINGQDQEDKKKGHGQDRLESTLALNADQNKDMKRNADNYAVSLRKSKREELQKRRRGIQTSS